MRNVLILASLLAGLADAAGARASGEPRVEDASPVTAAGGSTPRALRDRFADERNVRDFGAVPDDGRDDTAAIQAALDAGRPVFFPAGTYDLSAPLRISGAFHVRGPGATLTTSAPDGAVFAVSGAVTGFSLRDLRLTTSRVDLTKRGAALFSSDGQTIDGGLFDSVTFDAAGSYQNGISLGVQRGHVLRNVTIRNCSFTGPSAGVEVVHHVEDTTPRVSGLRIVENRFAHNGLLDDRYAGFGISLSGAETGTEVRGNDIAGYPYAGIEIVAAKVQRPPSDYSIHGNRVLRTGRGIMFDAADPSRRMARMSIVGNVIADSRYFQAFQFLADSEIVGNHVEVVDTKASPTRTNDFLQIDRSDRVTVTGNTFHLDLPAAEYNKARLVLYRLTHALVAANRIEMSGLVAVACAGNLGPVSDVVLAANDIAHRPRDPVRRYYPLSFDACRTTQVVGNVIRYETARWYSNEGPGSETVLARGNVLVRADTGEADRAEWAAFAATGSRLDLSRELQLDAVRVTGAPGGDVTLVLPPHQATYTIENAMAAGVITPSSRKGSSGAPRIPPGASARIHVRGGVAAYLEYPALAGISRDVGDASVTLVPRSSPPTVLYATPLTSSRTVTLSSSGARAGDHWRIVRTGLGDFSLDVGGLKTCPARKACQVDVAWDAAANAWRLAGYSEW